MSGTALLTHVYYYTVLPGPSAPAVAAFAADPGSWLPAPGSRSQLGWLVDLRADGVLPQPLAVQPAEVTVGQVEQPGAALLRRISWHARRADRLFPVLSGDLELASMPGGCQLSLTATYRPPLSVVGGAADRLLGHRVAEGCARAFVLAVAGRLQPATLPA